MISSYENLHVLNKIIAWKEGRVYFRETQILFMCFKVSKQALDALNTLMVVWMSEKKNIRCLPKLANDVKKIYMHFCARNALKVLP